MEKNECFEGKVEVEELVPNYIYHFKNVLSKSYCEKLIKWTETQVWESPNLFYQGHDAAAAFQRDLRTSKRIEKVTNQEFAGLLTERLNGLLPQKLDDGRTIRPMFETFRFDKYVKGGHFRPHYDDSKMRIEGARRGEASVFTVMVWLNEGYEGGETHFLPCKLHDKDLYVKGRAGDALVFWQKGMLHEGTDTTSGTKLICHTNGMYSPHVGTGKRPIPQRFRYAKSIRKKKDELLKGFKHDADWQRGLSGAMEEYEKTREKAELARKANGFQA